MAECMPTDTKKCSWLSYLGHDLQNSSERIKKTMVNCDLRRRLSVDGYFALNSIPKVEEFSAVCCKICKSPVKLQSIMAHMSLRHPECRTDQLREDEELLSFRIMVGCIPSTLLKSVVPTDRCARPVSPSVSLARVSDVKHEPPDPAAASLSSQTSSGFPPAVSLSVGSLSSIPSPGADLSVDSISRKPSPGADLSVSSVSRVQSPGADLAACVKPSNAVVLSADQSVESETACASLKSASPVVVSSDQSMGALISIENEVPGAFVDILNKFENDASLAVSTSPVSKCSMLLLSPTASELTSTPAILPPPSLKNNPASTGSVRTSGSGQPVSLLRTSMKVGSPLPESGGGPLCPKRHRVQQQPCVSAPHVRQYDPSRHCGVWIGGRNRHCTRALDCRQHNLEQKAQVVRPLPFKQLLQRFKAVKVQMKPMSVRYDPKFAPANGHPAAAGAARSATTSAGCAAAAATGSALGEAGAVCGMVTYRDITNSPMFRRDSAGRPEHLAATPTPADPIEFVTHQPQPLVVCGASVLRRRSTGSALWRSGRVRRAVQQLLSDPPVSEQWTATGSGPTTDQSGGSLLKRRLSSVTLVDGKRPRHVQAAGSSSAGEAGWHALSGTVRLQWAGGSTSVSGASAGLGSQRPPPPAAPLSPVTHVQRVNSALSASGARSVFYPGRVVPGSATAVCLSLPPVVDTAALISSNACP